MSYQGSSNAAPAPPVSSLSTPSERLSATWSSSAGNPLVQIKRDRSKESENAAREREINPRGIPSKGGKLTDINAPTPTKPSLPMPERFKKPELWADASGQQHPLYRTSGHVYGERPPAIQEMQHVYYGNSHTFTNTFAGGMARDYSLNTAINKSRINGKHEDFGF